ncbi:MAG: hypothetical protein KJ645_09460 [Planctomycetes bacterium]|nr:hypothetical protein [Planctomycetota bacterium]
MAKMSFLNLVADTYTMPEAGGTVVFTLDSGLPKAGRNYLLLGSLSGTDPGYPLPGGLATLPLNLDDFTYNVVFPLLNTSTFANFLGQLDGYGEATAQMVVRPLPPGCVGVVLYFAYCLGRPFEFVSNPVEVEVVL